MDVQESSLEKGDLNLKDFASKGIFGPEGFLESLESLQQQSKSKATSASTSSVGPSLPCDDKSDKNYRSQLIHDRNHGNENETDCSSQKNIKLSLSLSNSNELNSDSECKDSNTKIDTSSTSPSTKEHSYHRHRGPPEDAAFLIDHILERIFSTLPNKDLLNCRLVSFRWALFACKELQKSVTIHFTQCMGMEGKLLEPKRFNEEHRKGNTSSSCRVEFVFIHIRNSPNPPLYLDDLTDVMNTSISGEFPCKSFEFNSGPLTDRETQRFFTTHGSQIETLQLGGLLGFDVVLADLKKLLLSQVPDLKTLDLGGKVILERPNYLNRDCPVPEEVTPSFTVESFNNKLTTLRFLDKVSQPVFQEMLKLCPNLQEVDIPCKKLRYFLEPCNRLHLLKTLVIDADDETLGPLEAVAREIEGSKIKLRVTDVTVKVYRIIRQPHMWFRVTKIINTILQSCFETLESLVWDQLRFLQGLKMPQEMPRLKEMVLYNRNYHPLNPTQYFPADLCLCARVFPKLASVKIINVNSVVCANYWGIVTHFFDNFEPLSNVKVFSVENSYGECSVGMFRGIFPNARFFLNHKLCIKIIADDLAQEA